MIFRFLLGMVFVGSVASLPAIWNFADLSMGLMALTNLVAIVILFQWRCVCYETMSVKSKKAKHLSKLRLIPINCKIKNEANRDAWKD